MFFNPGNVSNSGNGGTGGGGINIADIMPIISPLLSDATFDVISNKIIFTKRNGETFELDLSSLKGLTREEVNSMIINLEEKLDKKIKEIDANTLKYKVIED